MHKKLCRITFWIATALIWCGLIYGSGGLVLDNNIGVIRFPSSSGSNTNGSMWFDGTTFKQHTNGNTSDIGSGSGPASGITTIHAGYGLALSGPSDSPTITYTGGSSLIEQSFFVTYTGAEHTWVVPDGVSSATVKAWGGGGGSGFDVGGGGGYASSVLSLTPGESVSIKVGGGGGNQAVGAWPNGGNGTWDHAGAGGGSTKVTALSGFVDASGGGGSSEYSAGGAGGGLTGIAGESAGDGTGGGAGTQSAGGAVGAGDSGGTSGSLGLGGNGSPYGGGGGGGFYGGGGGGHIGGGGGGSSWGDTVTAGSGATPGNSTDTDRGTAGNGAGYLGNGNPGICKITYYGPAATSQSGTAALTSGTSVMRANFAQVQADTTYAINLSPVDAVATPPILMGVTRETSGVTCTFTSNPTATINYLFITKDY